MHHSTRRFKKYTTFYEYTTCVTLGITAYWIDYWLMRLMVMEVNLTNVYLIDQNEITARDICISCVDCIFAL